MNHLTEAIEHLSWFQIPHDFANICRIARDLAADDARVARGLSGGGPGSSEISDPTGNAAVAGIMADDAKDVAATMLGAMESIEETAAVCVIVLNGHDWPQPTDPRLVAALAGRYGDHNARLSWAIADLHRIHDLLQQPLILEPPLDPSTLDDVHHELVVIAENAKWLHGKAEALWNEAPARHRDRAEQKPRIKCKSCARFEGASGRTREVDVDPEYGDLCAKCGRYRKERKHLPDEPIIRGWDYGKRPGMADHMRAKAAASTSKKRRRAAC